MTGSSAGASTTSTRAPPVVIADAHQINVAPHNYYGHLATMMSGHFSAAVPDLRIMELRFDNSPLSPLNRPCASRRGKGTIDRVGNATA